MPPIKENNISIIHSRNSWYVLGERQQRRKKANYNQIRLNLVQEVLQKSNTVNFTNGFEESFNTNSNVNYERREENIEQTISVQNEYISNNENNENNLLEVAPLNNFPANVDNVKAVNQNDSEVEKTNISTENIIHSNDGQRILHKNEQFLQKLRFAFIDTGLSHVQGDAILKVIKTHNCLRKIPGSTRSLLQTPRISPTIIEVYPGEYLHIGLEAAIKQFLLFLPRDEVPESLQIDINTDGARLFKNTGIWPIQCKIANLQESEILLIGVYKGKKKPQNSSQLFNPLTEEYRRILASGGIDYHDQKIPTKFRLFVGDGPGRAFVLKHKSHRSKKPCSKCHVIGKTYTCQVGRKVKNYMTYIGTIHEPRTLEEFQQRIDKEHYFVESSPLEELLSNPVNDVVFEYMHLVLLGVMKKLLSVWINGQHNKNLQLKDDKLTVAKERLVLISKYCPQEYARKPTDLSAFESFKATECRQIILVTGLIIFQRILPKEVYIHFLWLHAAIRCLVYYANSEIHLRFSEVSIIKFVERAPVIYHESFMSYNVHGLIHLTNDVIRFGNLDNFSAFSYENNNRIITNLVRKPNLPLQQIANRLAEQSHIQYQKKKQNKETRVFNQHSEEDVPDVTQYHNLRSKKWNLSTKNGDNCVLVYENICKIQNIYKHRDNALYLKVSKFNIQKDLYDVGLLSTQIGIYLLSDLGTESIIVPFEGVSTKCFLCPYNTFDSWNGIEFESTEQYVAAVM